MHTFGVQSVYGNLKFVLMHRPGSELSTVPFGEIYIGGAFMVFDEKLCLNQPTDLRSFPVGCALSGQWRRTLYDLSTVG